MIERQLPSGRLSRLTGIGRIAGGIAGDMLSGAASGLFRTGNESPEFATFSPSTARAVADRLAEMRGAAMKVGQLLSMDGGYLLPRQLSDLLSDLRQQAYRMPLGDVARVLKREWGAGWQLQFERFSFTPFAAASIGQVHAAKLDDGTQLAVKVQYPGVRESIDSDVDNIAMLLRMSGMLPKSDRLAHLFDEAKRQLRQEADYLQEQDAIEEFARLTSGDSRFVVPRVLGSLSTESVLSMEYLDGVPIEDLADAPQETRQSVAVALFELGLQELFSWGVVQTDSNFANYKYDAALGRIQLLDFGAVRRYGPATRQALRQLLISVMDGDDRAIVDAAATAGYLNGAENPTYRAAVVGLLKTAAEPLRTPGEFDFGTSTLPRRMSNLLKVMRTREKFHHIPPVDILFLHRKLGGLYLLFSRLNVRLPTRDLVRRVLLDESPE